MGHTILFEDGEHRNILLEGKESGHAVQANHHLIVHSKRALVLDPGGPRVFNRVISDAQVCHGPGGDVDIVFFSHQDPDIVSSANGWMLATDARAYVSQLWHRFVPHVVPSLNDEKTLTNRLEPIPDEGGVVRLAGAPLVFVPAHFLHSCGNFHLYDPSSKILYTGDLGASLGNTYPEVPDFDAHVPYMEGFHRRYMASNAAMRLWADLAVQFDIEVIAPQHGAFFRGKPMVERFIAWCRDFQCGTDVMPRYQRPAW
jgi:flavorubredoxin